MTEWISVEEMLPEDKQTCIVWAGGHAENAFVARYIGGREFHDFFKNWIVVTHWMPMPIPPKLPGWPS